MRICSVVMNSLKNDARVLKIGKTISLSHTIVFTALSEGILNKFMSIDELHGFKVMRVRFYTRYSHRNNMHSKSKITHNRRKTGIISFFMRSVGDIRFIHRVFRVLISEDFDCYYCNDFNTLIAGYFASRRKRAKLIYDTHELWAERSGARRDIYHRMKRNIEYYMEHFLIRRCDLVITVSDGIADELVRRYSIPRPVVIRNLDEEKPLPSYEKRMETRRQLGIPEDTVLLVYQGSFTADRGIPELLEAMNSLPDNVHLLLMGPEPETDIKKSIISNPRIHYPGLVPLYYLHDFAASGDIGIVVYHSVGIPNYFFTFPNKLSQYMNEGLAVLFYDCLESRKIINKYNNGMIIHPIDIPSIESAVKNVLNTDLNILKSRSREAFLNEYKWSIDSVKLQNAVNRLSK